MLEELKARLEKAKAEQAECLENINKLQKAIDSLSANYNAFNGAIQTLESLIESENNKAKTGAK